MTVLPAFPTGFDGEGTTPTGPLAAGTTPVPRPRLTEVHGWGRTAPARTRLTPVGSTGDVLAALSAAGDRGLTARGLGRSYGDVCLNPGGTLWSLRGLDRFIAWDEATGELTCEAGMLLRDIQRTFVPRGWMLPVTPGTQLATVGGAIANDVHGKNHHVHGSFGDHVQELRLLRTDVLDVAWRTGTSLTVLVRDVDPPLLPLVELSVDGTSARASGLVGVAAGDPVSVAAYEDRPVLVEVRVGERSTTYAGDGRGPFEVRVADAGRPAYPR